MRRKGLLNRGGVPGITVLKEGLKAFFLYKDGMKDSTTRAHLAQFADGRLNNGCKRVPIVVTGFADRKGSVTGNGNGIDRYLEFHAVGSSKTDWALLDPNLFRFIDPNQPAVQRLMSGQSV